MKYGYVKVAASVPQVRISDCKFNAVEIENDIVSSAAEGVEVIVFPELSMTGYSCGDLFLQPFLLEEAEKGLMQVMNSTRALETIAIIGMPVVSCGAIYNVAAVIQKGKILGVVPKTYLPNYKEFYEKRWFTSGEYAPEDTIELCGCQVPFGRELIFENAHLSFGIEICEDVWAPVPPSSSLTLNGADVIFNLSASDESVGKHSYLKSLLSQQSARTISGYVYASCGFGESTTDVVFGGNGFIYENGKLLSETERFSFGPQLLTGDIDVDFLRTERRCNTTFAAAQRTLDRSKLRKVAAETFQGEAEITRSYNPWPFVPAGKLLEERCDEIFNIQVSGLAQRVLHSHARSVVVGISGGLDSTLALLVCVRTFDKLERPRKEIVGVTMPGFGTTDRTYTNAMELMRELGITIREISIKEACLQHFKDIGHDESDHNVVYENSQARERTQILMDVANQMGGLVIGTGDLSELALGWATYNGDHMSMYAVNASVPKTLVKHLVKWTAVTHMDGVTRKVLLDIVDTPISPELIPADEAGNISQITEDLVGPYELHDFFLYCFLRCSFRPEKIYYLAKRTFAGTYDEATILKWLRTFYRRFFNQQFKRSCLPDGPKVGSIAVSPRGDWRMPSDASSDAWLRELSLLGD